MKKSDFKGLDTKELAERIDTNKKFKKNKTGCRYQQQNG